MWCWRRLENISWTDRVRNKKSLHSVKKRKQYPTCNTRKRKANWLGHILCRNCLLEHVTEGKIGGRERRPRRHTQILDYLKETRRYCDLERGSASFRSVENSFWIRLWTCTIDYVMIMMMMMIVVVTTRRAQRRISPVSRCKCWYTWPSSFGAVEDSS